MTFPGGGIPNGKTLRQRAALVDLRPNKEARRLFSVSGGELCEVRWEGLWGNFEKVGVTQWHTAHASGTH